MKRNKETFWEKFGLLLDKYYRYFLLISVVFLIISIILVSKLKLEFNWISLLPKNDISTKEFIAIEKGFASSSTIIVLIQGKDKNTLIKLAENVTKDIKYLGKEWIIDVKYKLNTDFFIKNLFLLMETNDINRFKNIYFFMIDII